MDRFFVRKKKGLDKVMLQLCSGYTQCHTFLNGLKLHNTII